MNPVWYYAIHLAALGAGAAALCKLSRRDSSARMVVTAVAAAITMAVFVFSISEPDTLFSDFYKAYYPAAQAVLGERGSLQASMESGAGGFVNLPVLAWLFAPFGLLPPTAAGYAFFALGLIVILAAWRLLVQLASLDRRGALLLLLVFAASGPLHNSLREGNTTHVTLLLLVLGLLALRRGRELAAGVLFAIAALLKLPLLLVGMYFVLRGRWRVAIAGAAVCLGVVVASIALFGWDLHLFWYEHAIAPYTRSVLAAFNVQSVHGFVARLEFGPAYLYDWTPLRATAKFVLLANAAVCLLLASTVAVIGWPARWRRGAVRELPLTAIVELEVCLVLTLALVTSTVSWSHYYSWMLLPAAFLAGATPHLPATRLARSVGWCALVAALPPVLFLEVSHPVLAQIYSRLAVSHYLAGGLLMFAVLAWGRWTASSRAPAAA